MTTIQPITNTTAFDALLFSVSRTDDTDWLRELREGVADRLDLDEQDKFDLNSAIDLRFSQLNAISLPNTRGNWDLQKSNPHTN